ncbi:MAG: hypothetical protein SNJ64_05690 [Endomicrobiia bacterium]
MSLEKIKKVIENKFQEIITEINSILNTNNNDTISNSNSNSTNNNIISSSSEESKFDGIVKVRPIDKFIRTRTSVVMTKEESERPLNKGEN